MLVGSKFFISALFDFVRGCLEASLYEKSTDA